MESSLQTLAPRSGRTASIEVKGIDVKEMRTLIGPARVRMAAMPIRKTLRADLKEARKARDSELTTLLRTLIAAIENAEAVDISVGEGSSEAPRRRLTDREITTIILSEADDLRAAANDYEGHDRPDEANRLHALSNVARSYSKQTGEDHK